MHMHNASRMSYMFVRTKTYISGTLGGIPQDRLVILVGVRRARLTPYAPDRSVCSMQSMFIDTTADCSVNSRRHSVSLYVQGIGDGVFQVNKMATVCICAKTVTERNSSNTISY